MVVVSQAGIPRQTANDTPLSISTILPGFASLRRDDLSSSASVGDAGRAHMIRVIKTIDAHVGGQPLRLVVDGVPRPSGRTPMHQREWCLEHADASRRAVVLEPRGH